MMIIIANLWLSWFFAAAGGWVMERAHRRSRALPAITAIAGLLLTIARIALLHRREFARGELLSALATPMEAIAC
jgi:hypothetical protein